MSTATQDALARAIDYLGATDLGNGRHAFTDGPSWCIGTERTLSVLGRRLLHAGNIAMWGKTPEQHATLFKMPSWWTPEQQFAWRIMNARGEEADPGVRYTQEPSGAPLGFRFERLTVDLTTGEEIAA
jgi:hypothetical protein